MDPKQASASQQNAILVSRTLLLLLKSALKENASSYDKLPPDREILNDVIPEMASILIENPIYFTGRVVEVYKWFDSEVVTEIQNSNLVDKGRFVDACIVSYLWGERGMKQYCAASKVIRARELSDKEKSSIRKKAAEIAAAKITVSKFLPTSLKDDILDKISE